MWTYGDAPALVRELEPIARRNNYATALGGSVLHKGLSHNDIDIIFLPLENQDIAPSSMTMIEDLKKHFSEIKKADDKNRYASDRRAIYKAVRSGRRIDLFIYY
jgi:hypothetical protein